MKGLKILQINKFYYPSIGGVETVVKQYSELCGKFHDVDVLCVSKKMTFKTLRERINNLDVIRCSSFGTFFSMPFSLSFFFHFFKLYRKYDIIHFHEPFPLASLLSLFLSEKNKIVITWHSDIIKQRALKKTIELFQSNLCKKASLITTTSPNLLDFSSVISKYKSKVSIIPLSIETKEPISDNRDEDYILYLGRLSYYKGIQVLLKAYQNAKTNKKLIIVGNGGKKIVRIIKDAISSNKNAKKKIEFVNKFVSEKEKQEYLRNCSFLVFPSTEPSEAFGIIQLEAMIYQKPIINTNLPTGVPYVSIHNSTGLTVPPKDIDSFSSAIDELAFNKSLSLDLGKKGRKRVLKHFSNDIIEKKLLQAYLKILS